MNIFGVFIMSVNEWFGNWDLTSSYLSPCNFHFTLQWKSHPLHQRFSKNLWAVTMNRRTVSLLWPGKPKTMKGSCAQCLFSRCQYYKQNLLQVVRRHMTQEAVPISGKVKIPRSRKFLLATGVMTALGGVGYLSLKEQHRRKVRVTAGGFVRFLR